MPRTPARLLLWLLLVAALAGCADYGFGTGPSPAAVRDLRNSIQKEFDLLVKEFDTLDGQGDLELCAPVRFAVARYAVYQTIGERKSAGMERLTRFILRARRAMTAAREQHKNRKCVDSDGDKLTDLAEVRRYKTDPNNADTDADGLSDGLEIRRYRTNPLHFDTDGDMLSDGEEVQFLKVSPRLPDSDGDGYADGFEVRKGTDPRDHCSMPAAGPRLKGPRRKCIRPITRSRPANAEGAPKARQVSRPEETARPARPEFAEPLFNKELTHGPLNP